MTHPADMAIESLRSGHDLARTGYTSDLSVDEAILLDETGYEPCGMVTGTTVFHVGYQGVFTSMLGNVEMAQITRALHDARRIAMSEMVTQTERNGGHGVVGVRLQAHLIHGSHLAEFFVMGTAIRPRPGVNVPQSPYVFTSGLSGKEFYLLFKAGYIPVGLVTGNCVYHVQRRNIAQWFSQMNKNVELENFTEALYSARELAMDRLEREARMLNADGVVGMNIHEQSHVWGSHVIEFLASGTAIRQFTTEHQPLGVTPALPLNDY